MGKYLKFKKDQKGLEQVLSFAPDPIFVENLSPAPKPVVIIAVLMLAGGFIFAM